MSRIGNKLITIPAGVTVEVADGNEVTVKGPKGSLTRTRKVKYLPSKVFYNMLKKNYHKKMYM